MSEIRIPEKIWNKVYEYLFQNAREHFMFFLAETITSKNKTIFLVKDIIEIDEKDTTVELFAVRIKTDALLRVTNTANTKKLALIEIHNHVSGYGDVNFSNTDEKGFEEFVPYVLDVLPDLPYAALVTTDKGYFEGRMWNPQGKCSIILFVKIIGERLDKKITTSGKKLLPDLAELEPTYARQKLVFGKEGQKTIKNIRVGIVGVGGIGSHLAQQLAYLGVKDFVIIDSDKVEDTNLNRLIGANQKDIGELKVNIIAKMILEINPNANVVKLGKDIRNEEVFEELKNVDVIFGGVDNEGPRLILEHLSYAYYVPYIDSATGIDVENKKIALAGGQVMIVQPDGPCMENCAKRLDMKEVSDYLATQKEFENRVKLGYVKGANIPNPSVVSLNGIISSYAVNQFIKYITNIGNISILTNYDFLNGMEPSIVPCHLTINEKCIHNSFRGIGDKIHLERFINQDDLHANKD